MKDIIEYKNVPIFQYGYLPNCCYIPKEVVEKALSSFLQAPVIDKTGIEDKVV
jgi:hypothetical protein